MSIDLDELARNAVAITPTRIPEMHTLHRRVDQRRRNRRLLASALAVPLLGIAAIGSWAAVNRAGTPSQTIAADADNPSTAAGETPVAASLGEFVWPAPSRNFASLDELTNQFSVEVLAWDQVRRDGGTEESEPQSFTLVNLDTNREVHLLAVPSPNGWGFIQIGESDISIGESAAGGFAVRFQRAAGATMSNVEIRYLDGHISTDTTTSNSLDLPSDRSFESVLSVLITYVDDSDAVVTASGGQITSPDAVTPPTTALTSTSVENTSVEVLNVAGLPADIARQWLDEIGLKVSILEVDEPGIIAGIVVSTDPVPGTRVDVGTVVILNVAGPST